MEDWGFTYHCMFGDESTYSNWELGKTLPRLDCALTCILGLLFGGSFSTDTP